MWYLIIDYQKKVMSFLNTHHIMFYISILITENTRTIINQNVWTFSEFFFIFFTQLFNIMFFTHHFHHDFDWLLTSWKSCENIFWKYFKYQNDLVLMWTLPTLIGNSHRHQESWFLTPPLKYTPNHTENIILECKT